MKENMLQIFCFQELQNDTEMVRLVLHGNYCMLKVGLSPFVSFFVDEFVSYFALLQLHSNHIVFSF